MAMPPLLLLLLLFGSGDHHSSLPEPSLREPYDLLFTSGVRHYYRADWEQAAALLERSLLGRSALRRLLAHCRRLCQGPHSQHGRGLFAELLGKANCLGSCLAPSMHSPGTRHRVSQQVRDAFHSRAAYNYLQLSYFKLGELGKAAAAAQTFFEANPDHEEMRENLATYRKMEGVKPEYFQDREAQPHWVAYVKGMRLFEEERFDDAIVELEKVPGEFLSALEECKAECEGPYHSEDYSYLKYQSHLYEAITDHYLQVLTCAQECVRQVSNKPGRGEPRTNFLPSIFNFLQMAYHKVGNYPKAVECIRTFLLFQPTDHSALYNLAFYQSRLPANQGPDILPRENIKNYIEESLLQKEMLYLAVESLGHHFIDPDSWTPHELIPHSVQNNTRPVNMSIPLSPNGTGQASDSQQKSVLGQEGSMDKLRASAPPLAHLKLVMNGSHLRGTHRVVFDGVLTHQECVTLRSVAHTLAVLGEAEPGDNSAHPQSTNLKELSIKTVLMLARDSLVDPPAARLYYHASVRVQRITQQFFTTLPLRPSISILSCRGPVTGDQEASRGTVSRDPCLQEPEGAECWRESLQDSAGDYRGFLYLNDEFDGGEFYFTDQGGKRVSEEISPKCGRLVVFLSGRENAHSVRPVTDGQRCTLTLTLTGRAQHEQEEYPTVESLLELLFPSSSPLGEPGHLLEPAHQDQESPGQLGRAREERSQAREGRQRQRREKQPRPAAGREIPFVRDEL